MPKPINKNDYNLERFFNLSPDILCIAGYDGYLKKVNPALANLLGYSIDELLNIPIINLIHEDDRKLTSKFRNKLKLKIPLLNFENRYLTKDGKIVWLSWTSISEEENNLIYAVAKDITHIKKLEEERNLLLKNITKLNADLKKFTYMVSHDLRSPVSNVISLFELLDLSKIMDLETREYLSYLNEANLEMENTLNKYVDAIKSDKRINEEIEVLNLNEVFLNVKNSISELIKKSKANFTINFSELPQIHFNEFYLQSIFLNLISNSLKFSSRHRELNINISSHNKNNIPQLIYTDNGIGIDLSKTGDNIFSLHQTNSHHKQSKGIGLYLVQDHMVSLGGKITVKSKLGVGTTFTLDFKPASNR
jgi:PAS domain S-box-containing protein